MKLALDTSEVRSVLLALLADPDVREAVRRALEGHQDPAHLGIREFARRWSVSARTVHNWLRRGLPVVRVGRVVRVPVAKGDAWVSNATTSPRSSERNIRT